MQGIMIGTVSKHQQVTQGYWDTVVSKLCQEMSWLHSSSLAARLEPEGAELLLSPDLEGSYRGRHWFIHIVYDPLTGEINLYVQCTFRGASPGDEPSTYLPWFFFGPLPGILGVPAVTLGNRILRRARLDTGVKPQALKRPGILTKVAILASSPKLEAELQSTKWMSEYSRWESLRFTAADFPPFFFGFPPKAVWYLPIHQKLEPSKVSEALARLPTLADSLDASLGAPDPFTQPIERRTWNKPVSTKKGTTTVSCELPTFTCPACQSQEVAYIVSAEKGAPVNLMTAKCHKLIFRARGEREDISDSDVAGLPRLL